MALPLPIYTMLLRSDEKGIEGVAGKTGEYIK
jgi:hypothetical protein